MLSWTTQIVCMLVNLYVTPNAINYCNTIFCTSTLSLHHGRKAGMSRCSFLEIIESVIASYTRFVVDSAAAWSHEAVMTNMGQCCVAGSRTFVHEKIYDKFVAKSRELGQKRTYGDPYEMTTKNGPQVRKVGLLYIYCLSTVFKRRRRRQ